MPRSTTLRQNKPSHHETKWWRKRELRVWLWRCSLLGTTFPWLRLSCVSVIVVLLLLWRRKTKVMCHKRKHIRRQLCGISCPGQCSRLCASFSSTCRRSTGCLSCRCCCCWCMSLSCNARVRNTGTKCVQQYAALKLAGSKETLTAFRETFKRRSQRIVVVEWTVPHK